MAITQIDKIKQKKNNKILKNVFLKKHNFMNQRKQLILFAVSLLLLQV